jgi:hypothetical protein
VFRQQGISACSNSQSEKEVTGKQNYGRVEPLQKGESHEPNLVNEQHNEEI